MKGHAHPGITTEDKIREIRRELSQRAHVYPRLVGNGSLTQSDADRQTAILRAILRDYESRLPKQGWLF